MRMLSIGLVSLLALGGCATVSMTPAATMIVSASETQDQSDFRDSCSKFSEAVYERDLVTQRNGVAEVFNMLAFGEAIKTRDTVYRERVQIETAPASVVFKTVEADAKWATRHLEEITGQVSGLLETAAAEDADLNLRKDLVAFEQVLVLSKKVRLSFVDVMTEIDGQATVEREAADMAVAEFETAIDQASAYIEKLSDAYALLDGAEATS
ncbi:MAG: hypothetical protein AAGK66_06260 [Pseudomonadota bacterium]